MEPLPTDAISELDCNYIIASSISFDSDNAVNQVNTSADQQKDNNDIKKCPYIQYLIKA